METEKLQKVATKYYCEKCDYNTSRLSSYNKHLTTAKHLGKQKETQKLQKVAENYNCDYCDKIYRSRSSLWKHKQKCMLIDTDNNVEQTEDPKTVSNLTTIVETLVGQNNKLMETIAENEKKKEQQQLQQQQENQKLQSQLIEAVKEGKTINNINNVNNVNYSINLFLNDQCKDAMSLADFIDNMKCQLEDLEDVGRLGYVDGISKLFIENLSGMEINKRPIHCTDLKRKSLYIKNNDEWTKDNNNVEMRKAIDMVANKNMNNINKWRNQNPEHHHVNGSGAKQQQYLKMVNEIQTFATDYDGKKGDKIIKNISDAVSIDRGMLKSGELEN
jgi:hypothetical protein